MASGAIEPEAPIVAIVLPVTYVAFARVGYGPIAGYCVAQDALQIFVRSVERKVGLRVVVKLPEAPRVRVVALSALFAEPSLVCIVAFVAGPATERRILECGGEMTRLARCCGVLPDKGKARQVVFEGDVVTPALFVMTGVTLFPLLPGMDIVIAMTGVAFGL